MHQTWSRAPGDGLCPLMDDACVLIVGHEGPCRVTTEALCPNVRPDVLGGASCYEMRDHEGPHNWGPKRRDVGSVSGLMTPEEHARIILGSTDDGGSFAGKGLHIDPIWKRVK